MMPELGRYAFSVLGSWGSSFGLVLLITLISLYRAKTSKATLAELEKKHKGK
ncbi:MAG: heme exporter protein CcmD [Rhodobacteraceae bacterium]|nr:heme exporter protein CcmD [Paracoccaceae bacterium]